MLYLKNYLRCYDRKFTIESTKVRNNKQISKLGYFSVFGFLGRYLYFGRCGVLPVSFLYRFYREGKG